MDKPTNGPMSQAFQAEPTLNVPAAIGEITVGPRTEPYADWDDFRTNSPAVQRVLADLATHALPDVRNAECLPLPPDLPGGTEKLGLPVASFALPTNMLRRFLISVLAIGGGLLLLRNMSSFREIFILLFRDDVWIFFGIVLYFAGTAFGVRYLLKVADSTSTCWIFEGGIICQAQGKVDECTWADLQSYYIASDSGALTCVLDIGNDRHILLDAKTNPNMMPIIELIDIKATSAKFLPLLKMIVCGPGVSFGPLEFTVHGAWIRGHLSPWADTSKFVADGNKLLIDCRDFPSWLDVPIRQIPFPWLVQLIAHIMIEECKWLPTKHEESPRLSDTHITEAQP